MYVSLSISFATWDQNRIRKLSDCVLCVIGKRIHERRALSIKSIQPQTFSFSVNIQALISNYIYFFGILFTSTEMFGILRVVLLAGFFYAASLADAKHCKFNNSHHNGVGHMSSCGKVWSFLQPVLQNVWFSFEYKFLLRSWAEFGVSTSVEPQKHLKVPRRCQVRGLLLRIQ